MGYSPLDGLTIGTRSGNIDGNAVLRLASDHGIEKAHRILNYESGLLGLGGNSGMRVLNASKTPEAEFAIAHFCYWANRHAGSMIAAMNETGSAVKAWIVPADEESTIAQEAAAAISRGD